MPQKAEEPVTRRADKKAEPTTAKKRLNLNGKEDRPKQRGKRR